MWWWSWSMGSTLYWVSNKPAGAEQSVGTVTKFPVLADMGCCVRQCGLIVAAGRMHYKVNASACHVRFVPTDANSLWLLTNALHSQHFRILDSLLGRTYMLRAQIRHNAPSRTRTCWLCRAVLASKVYSEYGSATMRHREFEHVGIPQLRGRSGYEVA